MKKLMILLSMILPTWVVSQTYSKEELGQVESKSFMDAFGAINKILDLTIPDPQDPVRVSRAKIVNSKATRKSLNQIKRLNKAYEKGDIDFTTYITLKAGELNRSVEELIKSEILIKSKVSILKNPE